MRYRLSVLALIAVLAASCSSGAEESGVTSSPDSTQPDAPVTTGETSETTTTEGSADANDANDATQTVSGDDDFCDALRQQEDEEIDVTNPEQVEATLRAAQEALSDLVDDAPADIRPAFIEFVEASERAMEVYADYDFDLFAIPVSEIEAVQAAGLEAQNQVIEFCGLDDLVDEPTDQGDTSGEDDVPEELFAPPGLEDSSTTGIMTIMSSSAPYENVVDHYAELTGEEPRVLSDTPGEREVTMTGDPSSTPPSFIVWVQEEGGQVIVTVSVPESS